MTDNTAERLCATLRDVFSRVRETRMEDVPILNTRLAVEVVGMRPFGDDWLSVLVTPWCMNLMLLPQRAEDAGDWRPGSVSRHVFPSGAYEFIAGEEEGIGRYRMCSLFSPMFEFPGQAAAVATAHAVLDALMAEAGDVAAPAGRRADETATLAQRMETPLSRRALLRGALRGGA